MSELPNQVADDNVLNQPFQVADEHSNFAGAPSAPSGFASGDPEEDEDEDEECAGRLWACLRPKTARALDHLENIGSLALGLLLKHIVDIVVRQRADMIDRLAAPRVVLQLVATILLTRWAKHELWRLLSVDYHGLVQMFAEEAVTMLDDMSDDLG